MLKPGGVLMISTHGHISHQLLMPDVVVDPQGYGMMEASEQFDLSTDFYVHAIAYPAYVEEMLSSLKRSKAFELFGGLLVRMSGHVCPQKCRAAQMGQRTNLVKQLKSQLRTVTKATAHRLRSKS